MDQQKKLNSEIDMKDQYQLSYESPITVPKESNSLLKFQSLEAIEDDISKTNLEQTKSEIIKVAPTLEFINEDGTTKEYPKTCGFSSLKKVKSLPKEAKKPQPLLEILPPLSPDDVGPRIKMRQPFKILTDIWGVLTSYHFRDELYKYLDANMEKYFLSNYDSEDIKEYIKEMATRTTSDLESGKWTDMPRLDMPNDNGQVDKAEVVRAVVANLMYRKGHKEKNLLKGLDHIFNPIWNDGYRTRNLQPHVFDDVLPSFRQWNAAPFFIKLFSFATGPYEIQKLFLSASIAGDITEYMTCGFDARGKYKYDSKRYRQVVSSLSERDPKNLLYLTDSPRKGREAIKAGLTVFIVRRDGNRKYKNEDMGNFIVIDSLKQLDFYEFK